MRTHLVLLVALALATAVRPAHAEPDAIARDLTSNDPATLAWAAWNAAETRRRDLVSQVVARLRDAATDESLRLTRGNLVDATIRLGAMPDAKLMVELVRFDAEAAAVLVCRNGLDAPEAGLATFEALAAGREPWVAIGNALAARRTPGFAVHVLDELEIRRQLVVLDTSEAPRPSPSGSVPYSAVARRPEGFPPVVHYTLDFIEGGDLLSGGGVPVYLLRTVHTEPKSLFGGIGTSGPNSQACRVGWIHRMARPDVRPLFVSERIGHRFTGNQPFQREVARLAEDVYERYWAIVQSLVDLEHLTTAEARTLMPKLDFGVRDHRLDPRPPLPDPEVPEPRNPWHRRSAKRVGY